MFSRRGSPARRGPRFHGNQTDICEWRPDRGGAGIFAGFSRRYWYGRGSKSSLVVEELVMVRRSAIRVCLCAVVLLPLCLVAPSRGDWSTGGTTGIEGAKCTEGVNSCSTCLAGYWRTSNDDVCTVQKCNDSN